MLRLIRPPASSTNRMLSATPAAVIIRVSSRSLRWAAIIVGTELASRRRSSSTESRIRTMLLVLTRVRMNSAAALWLVGRSPFMAATNPPARQQHQHNVERRSSRGNYPRQQQVTARGRDHRRYRIGLQAAQFRHGVADSNHASGTDACAAE